MDSFIHTNKEGVEYRFAHLSLYDVFGDPAKPYPNGFVPNYRAAAKRKLLENMKLLEMPKEQQLTELVGFDTQEVNLDTFIRWIKTDPLAAQIVVKAAYNKLTEGDLTLPDDDVFSVFWRLVSPFGIGPARKNDDPEPGQTYGDGGGDPLNPTIPPTYSMTPGVTTETGSASAA